MAFDERVPPHSLEAEQAVLGACLLDPESIVKVRELLLPEHFYYARHGLIYAALLNVGKSDTITVSNHLRAANKLDDAGGMTGLLALIDGVTTTANVDAYAEIVERKARQRHAIHEARQAIESLHHADDEEDLEGIGLALQWALREAPGRLTDLHHIGEVAEQRLAEERKRKPNSLRGYPTGFRQLDFVSGGFLPSDMVVIAARPSVGKTALVLNMIRRSAHMTGKPWLIASKEMAKALLADRLILAEARIDGMKYQRARLDPPDWHAAELAVQHLKSLPIYCVDGHFSVSDIPRYARQIMREIGDLGGIAIDYLQLMPPEGKGRNRNRENEVAETAAAIKQLARDMNCPVLAISALNRQMEMRGNKRPTLGDLRESGAIEYNTDMALLLHRPEDKPNITEIIIAKNRNGQTGTVELVWHPQWQRFDDLAQ